MARDRKIDLETWHEARSVEALKQSFNAHLKYSQAKDQYSATTLDLYNSLAMTVRDRLVDRWIQTQQSYYRQDVKRVYYLSMEYLLGRILSNYLVSLDLNSKCRQAVRDLGYNLEEIQDQDVEPGLGNGGLGRLAACFLDSMATLELPAYGYGIRYEFGIFYQKIVNGFQVETADNWNRRGGNPWEIPRPEFIYPVKFYGKVRERVNSRGETTREWEDTHDDVMAMAYDVPVPGYQNDTVNNLRLWSARSTRELDFEFFNVGDYVLSVRQKQESETISKVLYPNDAVSQGKELRLKQEYFFVSASLQDIIRRHKKVNPSLDNFCDKVAIQLNDTHPALAIPELMRILIDEEKMPWDKAWDIAVKTFGYTNHTILPEALEKWPVSLLGYLLPRHLQIIYEINTRFLDAARARFPRDDERLGRMSIIEEVPVKSARMAHLAIVGSHSVNGVAALHTEILKEKVFKDFHQLFPGRFNNKTNGITQRQWLKSCNPELASLITDHIGGQWASDLNELKELLPLIDDDPFRKQWSQIKKNNKKRLADYLFEKLGAKVDPNSMFDVQVKRIHEYKRQLLNILHVVVLYNRIRLAPKRTFLPRTVLFSGKAAPSYAMAKLIVKLINSVGDKVNSDPAVNGRLKTVFLPNYCVSLAEKIIPAADLSQQISTAGTEASGTGNMKLALNGALTLGTLDGANIEIMEEVGPENIFIFGLKTEEVAKLKQKGYHPKTYYQGNPELKEAIDMVRDNYFSPENPGLFLPIVDNLLNSDPFLVLADFASYSEMQKTVEKEYLNGELWIRKSIINSARMGKFSSDRTIQEYADDIWNVHSINGKRRQKREPPTTS
ncbi:MAG: glycogen/starch/alpha-glucan phosphorylase [Nitrospinae bacterium]|nr:glycogen/starch/alpha-glucan phosphorylase [Nitrospinota bacterium]